MKMKMRDELTTEDVQFIDTTIESMHDLGLIQALCFRLILSSVQELGLEETINGVRMIAETVELGDALDRYTDPNDPEYDPEFDAMIRKMRPDWFDGNETAVTP